MITELNSPLKSIKPSSFNHLLCGRMGVTDVSKFAESYALNRIRYQNYTVGQSLSEPVGKVGYDRIAFYTVKLEDLIQLSYGTFSGISLPVTQLYNPFASSECFKLISLPKELIKGGVNHPEFL